MTAEDRMPLAAGALLVFLVTLFVYLTTMPASITLEDAGLFQMICHEGGIGHPPGYPAFVLACQAFVNLPFFDNSVLAGNILSAVFAAAACAVVVPVVFELVFDRYLAIVAGLLYGLSLTFWSQAIIIEVYSLAALLFLACLWICLIFRRQGDQRLLPWLALLFGFSLANHWPLQLLGVPMLLAVVAPRCQYLWQFLGRPANLVKLALMFFAGLMPYLSLFQSDPAVAVFGGIETFEQFSRYVARSAYDDQFLTASWHSKWLFQTWVWQQTLIEFSFLLAPLLVLGFFRSFLELENSLVLGLVLLYLGGTSLLIMLLAFEYSDLRIAIFRPYPVIAYLAAVVWLVIGCRHLMRFLEPYARRVVNLLPVSLVLLVAMQNYQFNDRSEDGFAKRYALELLQQTPEDAVLFVTGDVGVGLLGYLHHVKGLRADVDLRSWNSLVFSNRLTSAFAPQELLDETRTAFVAASQRRVLSNAQPDFPAINRGIVFEYAEQSGFACDGSQHGYIRQLVALEHFKDELLDPHERELHFGLLLAFTRQHIGLIMAGHASEEERQTLQELQQTFAGKLATLETLLKYPQGPQAKLLLDRMAQAAAAAMPSDPSSQVAGLVDEYRGRIALLEEPDLVKAADHLRRSSQLNPAATNASRCLLSEVLSRMGKTVEAKLIETGYEPC